MREDEYSRDVDEDNLPLHQYAGSSRDVLSEYAEDIKVLWTDPIVQAMLTRRKVRLEEGPGL